MYLSMEIQIYRVIWKWIIIFSPMPFKYILRYLEIVYIEVMKKRYKLIKALKFWTNLFIKSMSAAIKTFSFFPLKRNFASPS